MVLTFLQKQGAHQLQDYLHGKHEIQGSEDWVPGGFMDYVLMERMPKVMPPAY
ncbi:uncharacterized protein ASPGLDRAFT_45467 [Aspergillus glaucus CBS 516.65]|uniref:Uncharacterized protein n=1 Tax=Aspergillus glaucus CBS 516.65 TaxID=1160497 RepID=A0A1L9VNL2_ASPGL|nr:hypothetical protein ASPGLDRAFT_45467 [Aspergillus glaucus CBS 516.65]OJJ85496.1 hypothetical protein ASPGLDRAFT_45467 [Aspergillus glaucus CBS 516.65]